MMQLVVVVTAVADVVSVVVVVKATLLNIII